MILDVAQIVHLTPDSPIVYPGGQYRTIKEIDAAPSVYYERAGVVTELTTEITIDEDTKGDTTIFSTAPTRLLVTHQEEANFVY